MEQKNMKLSLHLNTCEPLLCLLIVFYQFLSQTSLSSHDYSTKKKQEEYILLLKRGGERFIMTDVR